MQPWLKNFRVKFEIRRMERRRSGRELFASLSSWLPVWLVLTGILLIPWRIGVPVLMALPVLMLARYFALRRRADMVLRKLYEIMRLNHPLADSLAIAGQAESGMLGIRMTVLAEALKRGIPFSEALRSSVPEVRRDDLAALAVADRSGRLLPELALISRRKTTWPFLNDVDSAYGVYLLMVLFVMVFAMMFVAICDFHMFRHWLVAYGVGAGPLDWAGFIRKSSEAITKALRSLAPSPPANDWYAPLFDPADHVVIFMSLFLPVTFAIIWAVFLRRTIHPFFRRERLTRRLRDAVLWRMPVVGSLIRWRCWADVSEILAAGVAAGMALPELADAAMQAAGNCTAHRRLAAWRRRLIAGVPLMRASEESRFPKLLRQALGSPDTTLAASLLLGSRYYRMRFLRLRQVIRALAVPASVLLVGLAVLLVALALYIPYTHMMSVAEATGGG